MSKNPVTKLSFNIENNPMATPTRAEIDSTKVIRKVDSPAS
jgi:hypothetical protein